MADANSTIANDDPTGSLFPLALVVTFSFCVVGTLGNCLVVISVIMHRNLRTSTNHLLVSLAICDLFVSVWVMPVAIYDMAQRRSVGKFVCNLWTTTDLMTSCCSIWHLCFISFERFTSLRWPIWYRTKRPMSMTISLICAPWTLSIVAALIMIIASGGFYSEETRECSSEVPLVLDILVPLVGFVVPASILISLYVIITHSLYSSAKKRSSWRANGAREDSTYRRYPAKEGANSSVIQYQPQSSGTTSDEGNTMNVLEENVIPDAQCNIHQPPSTMISAEDTNSRPDINSRKSPQEPTRNSVQPPLITHPTSENVNAVNNSDGSSTESKLDTAAAAGFTENPSRSQKRHASSVTQGTRLSRVPTNKRNAQSKERRATTIIIIVVTTFFLCWGPFFVVVTIKSVSSITSPLLVRLLDVTSWIGWANSAVNPVIYTIFNKTFRDAFKAILMCRYHHRVHVTS